MIATSATVGVLTKSTTKKRGRPIGARSWWRNPVNIAAHHANVLMELWLADAPIYSIRILLSSLAENPKYRQLIEKCWRQRGNQRLSTVPKPIKRDLCKLAIAHVIELQRQSRAVVPQVRTMLRRSKVSAAAKLKEEGWTEEQIAVWFNKLWSVRRRRAKNFKVLNQPVRVKTEQGLPFDSSPFAEFGDVLPKRFFRTVLDKVVEIVSRRAPAITLRRKAGSRKLRRKIQPA